MGRRCDIGGCVLLIFGALVCGVHTGMMKIMPGQSNEVAVGVASCLGCSFFILSAVFGGLWGSAVIENKHFKPTDCFIVDNGIMEYRNGCTCCCSHDVPTPCPPPPSPVTVDMVPSSPNGVQMMGQNEDNNEKDENYKFQHPQRILEEAREPSAKTKLSVEMSNEEVSEQSPLADDAPNKRIPPVGRNSREWHKSKPNRIKTENEVGSEISSSVSGDPDVPPADVPQADGPQAYVPPQPGVRHDEPSSDVPPPDAQTQDIDTDWKERDELEREDFGLLLDELEEVDYEDNVHIESQFCPDDCFSFCCTSECCDIPFTCYAAFWDVIVHANESLAENDCPAEFSSRIIGPKKGSNYRPIPSESKHRAQESRDARPVNTTSTCYFDIRNCHSAKFTVHNPIPRRTEFIVFVSLFGACLSFCCCYAMMLTSPKWTKARKSSNPTKKYHLMSDVVETAKDDRREGEEYDYSGYSKFETS